MDGEGLSLLTEQQKNAVQTAVNTQEKPTSNTHPGTNPRTLEGINAADTSARKKACPVLSRSPVRSKTSFPRANSAVCCSLERVRKFKRSDLGYNVPRLGAEQIRIAAFRAGADRKSGLSPFVCADRQAEGRGHECRASGSQHFSLCQGLFGVSKNLDSSKVRSHARSEGFK